jgi:hypothetical protein
MRLYLGELQQLFDRMDPSPLHERGLDSAAAEHIIDAAREAPAKAALGLRVLLGREPGDPAASITLSSAIREYFERRGASKRLEYRRLMRSGRRALVVGLIFLAVAIGLAQWFDTLISDEGRARLVSESLVIGGWVALWRPMEIFLYDWWPLLADARLFDRLSEMPVTLEIKPSSSGRMS